MSILRPMHLALAALGMTGIARAADELAPLVARLANEEFKTREEASAELVRRGRETPDAVQNLCLDLFLHSPEPEVRIRCKDVLRALFKKSAGFIGIFHQPRAYFDENGETRQGVEVVQVVPGQPADKAGLKVGDVIIALDGTAFKADAPAEEFGRRVRLMGAGSKASLQVDRAGEIVVISVTTGTAPEELLMVDPEARFQEWLDSRTEKVPRR